MNRLASGSCLIDVARPGRLNPKVIAMMHIRQHGRVSVVAWSFLLVAMIICYATIVAGIVGLFGAWTTSMVIFSAAMVGCIAALVYLAAAMRDIHAPRRVR
jgi:hypothetical protein